MKKCDKLWLYNGLKKYARVRVVPVFTNRTYFRLSLFMPRMRVGKVIVNCLNFVRSFIAIFLSSKDDVIVTWSNMQGFMLNSICRKLRIKRKIVSFMWIRVPNKHISSLKKSFENVNFMPVINNKALESSFKEVFSLREWNGFFLPDVFDDSWVFEKPVYKNKKYVFAGGFNNRDWNVLIGVAKETPDINYMIVCDRNAIEDSICLPNLTIKEKIPIEEYYALMKNAFVTVCPLKEDTTSGLINIMRSAQFGIPCVSTKLDVTAMYYPSGMNALLFNRNDCEGLKEKLVYLYNLDKKEYVEIADKFQKYIEKNFSPEENIKKLIRELKKRKWMR